MKWGKKLLIALAAALLMLMLTTSALADSLRFGTVDSSSVNLRAGMSTKSERLGVYKRGTWLRITGDFNGWYKVKTPDGKTGYMSKDYIYISAAAKGIIGIVDVSESLNLRAKASSSGRVLAAYPDGVPCILLSESGDWYHVSVDGKAGYFSADYIDKKYMTYSPDVATVVSKNGGSVNLRKGPGTDYGAIKSVKNGSYVMIIQQGNDWWKVSYNGSVGFMDADYLKDGIVGKTSGASGSSSSGSSSSSSSGSSSSSSSSSSKGYAEVDNPGKNQKLFLRQSASKQSKSLGAFSNGTRVTVLDQGNTWCKVKVDGKTGYMMTEYLKFYGLSASAKATVTHPDKTFVYLRGGPSQTTGKVLKKVPHGSVVTILTPGSTWSQVKYNGTTGYMMTRFLKD